MEIKIKEETVELLKDYSQVSIAFRVETRFRVESVNNGLGGFLLSEEKVEPPYVKNYDSERGEGPTRWLKRWDISHWGVLSAFDDNRRIGGAVVAYDTEGVLILEGHKDLAALWDIRVQPDFRRCRVGSKLFKSAIEWARGRGCRHIIAETQNINVPACRFYAKQGCKLRAIKQYAYADNPEEVQLVWYINTG